MANNCSTSYGSFQKAASKHKNIVNMSASKNFEAFILSLSENPKINASEVCIHKLYLTISSQ